MRRTANEIVHLRKFPRRHKWWWELDGRSCSGCGKLWRKAHTGALDGRPEWVDCLECEQQRLRGDWTRETEAEFIAKARVAFPGSYEPVRGIHTGPPGARAVPERDPQLTFDDEDKAA